MFINKSVKEKNHNHVDEAASWRSSVLTKSLPLVPGTQLFWSVTFLLGSVALCYPLLLAILQIHLVNFSLGPHFRSPIPSLSYLKNSHKKVRSCNFTCPLCSSLQNLFSTIHPLGCLRLDML